MVQMEQSQAQGLFCASSAFLFLSVFRLPLSLTETLIKKGNTRSGGPSRGLANARYIPPLGPLPGLRAKERTF